MTDVEGTGALLCAFRRNIVVAASAGTGKTHRLTALYVMLLLGLTSMGQGDDADAHPPLAVEHLVATTFSRAAAHEIRGRVEKALTAVVRGDGTSPFEAEIQQRRSVLRSPPSDAELVRLAERALDGWHGARIDTLHTLAFEVVRRHAISLGLAPGIRVASEDEARDLTHAAIEEVLATALRAGGAVEEGARAMLALGGGLGRTRDSLVPFFDRLDDEGIAAGDLRTVDHLADARALRQRLSIALAGVLSGPKRPHSDAAAEVLAALGTSGDVMNLPPSARAALDRLFTRKPKGMSADDAALFDLRDSMPGTTNADKSRALASGLEHAAVLEERERAVLSLVTQMKDRALEARTSRGLLGFGDILRIARDALRDRPEIGRDLRTDIGALLVDEFQDTSMVQRDLVYLLREREDRALARPKGALPGAADLAPHGLFLVGDRKQSIYGFRGADVAVFSRVAAELAGEVATAALDLPPGLASSSPPQADFVALRESRRSGSSIVAFVNAFSAADFAGVGDVAPPEVPMHYSQAEHLVTARPAGADHVTFIEDDGSLAADPLLVGAGPALREAFVAAAAAHALSRPGPDALAFRSIAILARRRATIPLVELALGRMGLPYVVAGRALFDTLEVRDAAALVRLVLDPRDRHALGHVLRGPMVGLSDGALLTLTDERGLLRDLLDPGGPSDLLRTSFPEEHARLVRFRARFLDARPGLMRVPPSEALRAATTLFELDRILAALPRAAARVGNVDRLVTLAADRGGSLLAFSRWLDRQISDETDEPEAVVFSPEDDAIRLTTIHAAKGLDFVATILVDLGAAPARDSAPFVFLKGQDGSARFVTQHRGSRGALLPSPVRDEAARRARDRAKAERRRITYVAITRARERLVLVGGAASASAGSMLSTFQEHRDASLAGTFDIVQAGVLLADALTRDPGPPMPSALLPDPGGRPSNASPESDGKRSELTVATTPLGVYRGCARRFRFRFLLGLEEPVDSGQLDLFEVAESAQARKIEPFERDDADPRVVGRAAHRVLERWPAELFGKPTTPGEIGRALAHEGLGEHDTEGLAPLLASLIEGPFGAELRTRDIHREEEIELVVASSASGEHGLRLRGTVDLFSCSRDGSQVDLIDYKLARPASSLDAHAFQLRSYALALARRFPSAVVRAGVVFLRGAPTPVWLRGGGPGGALTEAEHASFEQELAGLATRFAESRRNDAWPGVARELCQRQACGFQTACHRKRGR